MIDVIIPTHPKDLGTLDLCIDSIRKYVEGVRKIIVVSNRKLTDNAEWIDLEHFPFKGDSVKKIHGQSPRNGWYLMLLIKLYAPLCIPHVSENSLLCDSDTIFLNPVNFVKENFPVWTASFDQAKGKIQNICNGDGWMESMHPNIYTNDFISKVNSNKYNIEPISHQMVFQQSVLRSLMKHVEHYHKEPFWEIFLKNSISIYNQTTASEHQLYFLYCMSQYPELFKYYENFKWKIACETILRHSTSRGGYSKQVNLIPDRETLTKYQSQGWHWLSFQSHMRGITIQNYKDLCLMCGKQKEACSKTGCNNHGATKREFLSSKGSRYRNYNFEQFVYKPTHQS